MKSSKGNETGDLEELLSQLPPNEVRYNFVYDLLTKGKPVPMKFIEDVLNYYICGEHFHKLEELAEKEGIPEKIIEIFEKHAEEQKSDKQWTFYHVAEIAKKAGMLKKAIELYNKAGFFDESGEILKELGDFEEAITHFMQGKRYEKAAEIYESLGKNKKAKELYKLAFEHNKNFKTYEELDCAVKSAEKLGWAEKIKELKLKDIKDLMKFNTCYHQAAEKAEKIKEYELAITYYLKDAIQSANYGRRRGFKEAWGITKYRGRVIKCLSVYRDLQKGFDVKFRNEMVRDFYETYDGDDMYELAKKEGSIKNILPFIIELHEKNYKFHKAAQIAKKEGLGDKADKLFRKAIKSSEDGWDFLKAAEIAEEAGFTDMAKKLYIKSASHYEKYNKFGEAAFAAEKAGLHDKAVFYKRILELSN